MNYTSIRSALLHVSLPPDRMDEGQVLEDIAQAVKLLRIYKDLERKSEILHLTNYKAKLPFDLEMVELLTCLENQDSFLNQNEHKSYCEQLRNLFSEEKTDQTFEEYCPECNESVVPLGTQGNRAILPTSWPYWFDADIVRCRLRVLRTYKSKGGPNCHTQYCPNISSSCEDTYSISPDGEITTSIKEGYLCLSYLGIPLDGENFPYMPDVVHYQQAVASYAMYKYWERRANYLEEGADRREAKYKREWVLLFRDAKASQNMRFVTEELINTFQNRYEWLINSNVAWGNRPSIRHKNI